MSRTRESFLVFIIGIALMTGVGNADASKRIRGTIWIQQASGWSTGDDQVHGRVNANVAVSDIFLIGSIGADVPVSVDVSFENPSGFLLGGELSRGRFGIEINAIYLPKAVTGQASLRMCGGLLTEAECALLERLDPIGPGISVPAFVLAEESIGNLALTLGANYHLFTARRWDVWAGPMVAWSVWSAYDISDIRADLSSSVESALQGRIDQFDISEYSGVSPQNALTLGASAGAQYQFASRWGVLGQFRYFVGDDLVLPDGRGTYSAAGFSIGLSHRFGG